jgi:hypothetical protein
MAILFLSQCGASGDTDAKDGDTTISQLEKKMDNIESTDSTKTSKVNSQLGKEYTAKYICPMHCKDSGSDKVGKCSVCGMDMIENPNAKK